MSFVSYSPGKLIRITDLLIKHKEYENLKYLIAEAIVQSSGAQFHPGVKSYQPNSFMEGCVLFSEVTFYENEYIIVGHKCFMTLVDEGNDELGVTSIYVHPSMRGKGYAKRFLQTEFTTDLPIVIDTPIEVLKPTILENPTLKLFWL